MGKNNIKLGDAVEKVAKPIAKAIDKVFGTDIENCEGCEKRKKTLNNLTKPKKTGKRNNNTLDGKEIEASDWTFIVEMGKTPNKRFESKEQYAKAVEIANKYHPRQTFKVTSCVTCNKKLKGYFFDLYENNK